MNTTALSQMKEIRSVRISDRNAMAEMLQNNWEPLNVCKKVKRFLWWKSVDYSVLFGRR